MRLEDAILQLKSMQSATTASEMWRPDARAMLLVTLGYLIAVLSVPVDRFVALVWFAIYPIVAGQLLCDGYGKVALKSLYILPLVLLIGGFNPLLDTGPVTVAPGITIRHGWITFSSVTVRGLLSFQSLLILIRVCGFVGMTRAMERLGMPRVICTQLLMVYRYLTVLLQEALSMRRAREARGFGAKSLPLKDWGTFMGQLFLRTMARSERINRAMLSRGFSGTIPDYAPRAPWRLADTAWTAGWCVLLVALRFIDMSSLIHIAL